MSGGTTWPPPRTQDGAVGVTAGGGLRGPQHPRNGTGHTGRASLCSRRFCILVSGVHPSSECQPQGPDGDLGGVRFPIRFLQVLTDLGVLDAHPGPWPRAGRAGVLFFVGTETVPGAT